MIEPFGVCVVPTGETNFGGRTVVMEWTWRGEDRKLNGCFYRHFLTTVLPEFLFHDKQGNDKCDGMKGHRRLNGNLRRRVQFSGERLAVLFSELEPEARGFSLTRQIGRAHV